MAVAAGPKSAARKITSARVQMYLESKKVPTVVLGEVDRWLQTRINTRDTTVIHPSEMSRSDWCDRATWFRISGKPILKERPINLRLNLIFDKGDEIHQKWQSWFSDMGILWGRWECAICLESILSWSDQIGGKCPVRNDGGVHLWKYKEVPLRSVADSNVAGHADGVINPDGSSSYLLEIKSVGPGTLRKLSLIQEGDEEWYTKFSRISHVETSHFLQTQIYLHLINGMGGEYPLPVENAVILYENKADQQHREFSVEYDGKWAEPLLERAADIMWAVKKDREVLCPFSGCLQCSAYEEV